MTSVRRRRLVRRAVQVQPVSIVQVELQPSPAMVLPSSHCLLRELEAVAADRGARAARALRLDRAGRRAAVVRDEVAVVALLEALLDAVAARGLVADRLRRRRPASTQAKPGSSVQVALQPSPAVLLPSSHCSLPATMPSPHFLAMHFAPGVGHCQPGSTWQVDAAAVAGRRVAVVALSRCRCTLPSPHLTVDDAGLRRASGTTQFGSIWQVALQPSPETVLPSSQASPRSTTPSPHSIWVHAPPRASRRRSPRRRPRPRRPRRPTGTASPARPGRSTSSRRPTGCCRRRTPRPGRRAVAADPDLHARLARRSGTRSPARSGRRRSSRRRGWCCRRRTLAAPRRRRRRTAARRSTRPRSTRRRRWGRPASARRRTAIACPRRRTSRWRRTLP